MPPDDRRPVLQPPRFGLLALLVAIAVMGGLLAIVHYFGAYGASIAILFALCVAAHVLGNAMGTRLRDLGDRPVSADGAPISKASNYGKPAASDFAPLTRLRERHSLGKPVFIITVAGAILGGLLGYAAVCWLADARTGWHVFGFGTVAFAVLGAIWTFAAVSFVKVIFGEMLHAHRNSSGS